MKGAEFKSDVMVSLEGKRSRWIGRASNPVGGAMRRWVGPTPTPLRHKHRLACCAGWGRACDARRTCVRLCFSAQPQPARYGDTTLVDRLMGDS